ncbi:MAG: hypothetical protein Q4E11_05505 [Corynebacterium sp.]|uniref:hypothetical protein n=1 Tax=Corynebacterium sp. TaxID=1720 RepID=UPI0026DB622D|nr:hypothetical protein [Corynebacterium sp.]MDO5030022.1 hypothetical protein [Corynebacterium sp.]
MGERKLRVIALSALSATVGLVALGGCGGRGQANQQADSGIAHTQPGDTAASVPASASTSDTVDTNGRKPDEPILGAVGADGTCDESVIAIEHEKPTAHIDVEADGRVGRAGHCVIVVN